MLKIYDARTIQKLRWPENSDSMLARNFLEPLLKDGIRHYIDNAEGEMVALKVDDLVLPVSISKVTNGNCHPLSPSTYFGSFSVEKVDEIENPLMRSALKTPAQIWEGMLKRAKIDKVLIVNNWLLSTNLYPPLAPGQIIRIRNYLAKKYPRHAIAFRSICPEENRALYESLLLCQFRVIPCRPIFLVDTTKPEHFKSRMLKSDLKVLAETEYELITEEDLQPHDFPRMAALYRQLYIDKYSGLSPALNERFMEFTSKRKIFKFRAFRKEGRIDALFAYSCRHGVMTSPIFGYDTYLPQSLGLYRLISAQQSLEAKKLGALLNLSSGAGSYKTLRRATKHIEYLAVYTKHLNIPRRLPWKLMGALLNRLGKSVMMAMKD